MDAFYQDAAQRFAREDGTIPPLEEVKDAVREAYLETQVSRGLNTLAMDLDEDLAAKRTFDELATSRALAVRTSESFPLEGVPPADLPAEVFREVQHLTAGQMTDLLESPEGVYVARIKTHLKARVPPYEEVQDRVQELLVTERTQEAAAAAAEAFRATLPAATTSTDGVLPTLPQDAQSRQVTITREAPIETLGVVPQMNLAAFARPLGTWTEVIRIPQGAALARADTLIPPEEQQFAEVEASVREERLSRKQAEHLTLWLRNLRMEARLQDFTQQFADPAPAE